MDREELAWAAGFIDGEGSFGIQKGNGKRKDLPFFSAGQVDRRVLDRLCVALEVGKVYGPYTTKNPNENDYHYFRVTGRKKVIQIASMVWPWLSHVKREQYGRAIRQTATEPVLKTDEAKALGSSTLPPSAPLKV